jgi:rhodanese-related sulfurtransferase
MKKILIFLIMLFLLGCETNTKTENKVQIISASVGKTMLDESESIILLDVRTLSEYNEGHIENALLLPLAEIQTTAETVIPDKAKTYIIYCRSGNRSRQAADILLEMGYLNIYDMGGIIDWPYEIVY